MTVVKYFATTPTEAEETAAAVLDNAMVLSGGVVDFYGIETYLRDTPEQALEHTNPGVKVVKITFETVEA